MIISKVLYHFIDNAVKTGKYLKNCKTMPTENKHFLDLLVRINFLREIFEEIPNSIRSMWYEYKGVFCLCTLSFFLHVKIRRIYSKAFLLESYAKVPWYLTYKKMFSRSRMKAPLVIFLNLLSSPLFSIASNSLLKTINWCLT